VQLIHTADYGVPQLRSRLLIIASRDGTPFVFPKPTHAAQDDDEGAPRLEPYRTAWDAIGDVRPDRGEDLAMRGKWARVLPSIPEGQNYLRHTERGGGEELFGWRTRYWSFLLKLAKELPSWTIQASPGPSTGPFHWENRRLSMRELCRIQTFPDDIQIMGDYRAVHRQVGNAVPSLLAEVLGTAIRAQLLADAPRSRVPRLLPPVRTPVPKPERLRPVPEDIKRQCAGKHAAHPGTGLGTGAQRRAQQQWLAAE
jgi:DNA (cytosine-5)-methyltransferase 1